MDTPRIVARDEWLTARTALMDMYGKGGMVQATGRYHEPACACAAHRA
jgi:hypothetical protein